MANLPHSSERLEALRNVYNNEIVFHNGLSGPALGYTWRTNDAPLMEDRRDTLQELWAADAIDIDTERIRCHRGHRVRITPNGYLLLIEWQQTSRRQAA